MMAEQGTNPEDMQKRLFDGINGMKTKIEQVNEQFKDAD